MSDNDFVWHSKQKVSEYPLRFCTAVIGYWLTELKRIFELDNDEKQPGDFNKH